jgi:cephalosporin-C deacetylase-like acetyl esterase
MITRRQFLKTTLATSISPFLINQAYSQEISPAEQLRFTEAREKLLEKYFNERPDKIKNSETYIRGRKTSQSYREITFESSVNTNIVGPHEITLQYFIRPEQENKKENPSIVVVPMLNGATKVESGFAKYFSKQGIPSLTVSLPDYKQKLIDEINNVNTPMEVMVYILKFNGIYEQAILDHLQVIDWVTQKPELSNNKIGVTGVSFGGILSATMAGIDDRIKATVPILAGGDLGKILSTTKEKSIVQAREKAKKRLSQKLEQAGMNPDSLEAILRQGLKWDPLNYANNINPETTLMILAANDVIVPTKTGYELAEAINQEPNMKKLKAEGKLKVLNGLGHRSSVIAFPQIKENIKDFFKEKLK